MSTFLLHACKHCMLLYLLSLYLLAYGIVFTRCNVIVVLTCFPLPACHVSDIPPFLHMQAKTAAL
jgi:hypothetical protein